MLSWELGKIFIFKNYCFRYYFRYYVDAAHSAETKAYSIESLNKFVNHELHNGFHGHEGKYYPGVVGEMGCSWVCKYKWFC